MPPQMSAGTHQVTLVRHGETEWSKAHRHTGLTDVPLTDRGRAEAVAAGEDLAGRRFAVVLTSPLSRAAETCVLAGFGDVAEARADLVEWDYGAYEGLTTQAIQRERPGWSIWSDGVTGGGETIEEVAGRADAVVAELRGARGDGLVFSHAHFLRILTARWLELEPSAGRLFALDPATISVLGWEHERPVIREWNAICEASS
jgi:broad specificity phosphatase PhoE